MSAKLSGWFWLTAYLLRLSYSQTDDHPLATRIAAHHHWAFTIRKQPCALHREPPAAGLLSHGPGAGPGRGECFEGRAGRPVPAMTLSDVPHKPRPRAFAPPGHGLAIFPRSLSLVCLAVLRPRVPLPRYFVAAAHQSTPGPWCRGGVVAPAFHWGGVFFSFHVYLARKSSVSIFPSSRSFCAIG